MADTDDDLTPEDIAAAAERRRQIDEIERGLDEDERRRQERERLPAVHPPSEWLQLAEAMVRTSMTTTVPSGPRRVGWAAPWTPRGGVSRGLARSRTTRVLVERRDAPAVPAPPARTTRTMGLMR